MNPSISRLKLFFLTAFAAVSVGVFGYHYFYVWPQERCEGGGGWWDPAGRVCGRPVLVSDITGRTIQDKAAEAAARKAIGRPAAPAPKP